MEQTPKPQPQEKKGFLAQMMEKLDRKMQEQAKKSKGCCCGDGGEGGGSCSK